MKFINGCLMIILYLIIFSSVKEKPFKLSFYNCTGSGTAIAYTKGDRKVTYRMAKKPDAVL